jgi:hypothetical protein
MRPNAGGHASYPEREAAIHGKLDGIRQYLQTKAPAAQAAANHQTEQDSNHGIRSTQ